VYGHVGFEGWFQRVIRIFFDEVHTVKNVLAEISGDTASVKVVVQWEASVWNAPEANSKRIMLDAYQTWEVKQLTDERIVITKYTVDQLQYAEGSASL
jgi:nicotinate-nucleotide pyrophosphorylase